MAVHKHTTGGFRAYKKINGIEYQFYSVDENEANEKQRVLETKSRLANSLKSTRLFSACGRLIGVRVYEDKRPSKKWSIKMMVQLTVNGKQFRKEKKYQGSFEPLWQHALTQWRSNLKLTLVDIFEYKVELSKAKRLYIHDVGTIEDKIQSLVQQNNLQQ
jgi:hypothetical protein